jgi:hypothetical protein
VSTSPQELHAKIQAVSISKTAMLVEYPRGYPEILRAIQHKVLHNLVNAILSAMWETFLEFTRSGNGTSSNELAHALYLG